MSRNESVKSNTYRAEREEFNKNNKYRQGAGQRDTEKEKTAIGYKTERDGLKNPGREPDLERWQKK